MGTIRSYPLIFAPVQTVTIPRDAMWLGVGCADDGTLAVHVWVGIDYTPVDHIIYMVQTNTAVPSGAVSYIDTVKVNSMNYHMLRGTQ